MGIDGSDSLQTTARATTRAIRRMVRVIAWGSLFWDPRELRMATDWRPDGPSLPIEFSRIAADGRLTLVVDRIAGSEVRTWSCDSPLTLEEAVGNLSVRERCPPRDIGWVDLRAGSSSSHSGDVVRRITEWCSLTDTTAAVWTALPTTFLQRTGLPFSVENALEYLGGLDGEVRARAFEYIRRAPDSTMTEVRRSFQVRWPSPGPPE